MLRHVATTSHIAAIRLRAQKHTGNACPVVPNALGGKAYSISKRERWVFSSINQR